MTNQFPCLCEQVYLLTNETDSASVEYFNIFQLIVSALHPQLQLYLSALKANKLFQQYYPLEHEKTFVKGVET